MPPCFLRTCPEIYLVILECGDVCGCVAFGHDLALVYPNIKQLLSRYIVADNSNPVFLQIFRAVYCDSRVSLGEQNVLIRINRPYPLEGLLSFGSSCCNEENRIIPGESSLIPLSPGNEMYLFPGHLLPHFLGDRLKEIDRNAFQRTVIHVIIRR